MEGALGWAFCTANFLPEQCITDVHLAPGADEAARKSTKPPRK